jgi:hypothetical protein
LPVPRTQRERRGERVVDRPLQARPLSFLRGLFHLAPAAVPLLEDHRLLFQAGDGDLGLPDADDRPRRGEGEAADVLRLVDLEHAAVDDPRPDLRADVVLLQREEFDPEAAVVLQRPGDEAHLARQRIQALRDVLADLPHLFIVDRRIDHVARARRDQVDHLEAFLLHGPAHDDVAVEEDVLVADDRVAGMPAFAA